MADPTSYCTSADVASILSEHGLVSAIDDDFDYDDTGETHFTTEAISRSAVVVINFYLCTRYNLELLTTNQYLKHANAILAAVAVAARRLQSVPTSLEMMADDIKAQLREIKRGSSDLPSTFEHYAHGPTVSNYDAELGRSIMPVRTQLEESIGSDAVDGVKRWPAGFILNYDL